MRAVFCRLTGLNARFESLGMINGENGGGKVAESVSDGLRFEKGSKENKIRTKISESRFVRDE